MTGIDAKKLSGRCMCNAVEFTAIRDNNNIDACHCGQCRRWSGHYWASVNVEYATLAITKGADKVGWFRSSDIVRRGFCKECGSALFWQADRHPEHGHRIAISAGSLDAPTGLRVVEHIFVADKGDYYEIADDLPQKDAF